MYQAMLVRRSDDVQKIYSHTNDYVYPNDKLIIIINNVFNYYYYVNYY